MTHREIILAARWFNPTTLLVAGSQFPVFESSPENIESTVINPGTMSSNRFKENLMLPSLLPYVDLTFCQDQDPLCVTRSMFRPIPKLWEATDYMNKLTTHIETHGKETISRLIELAMLRRFHLDLVFYMPLVLRHVSLLHVSLSDETGDMFLKWDHPSFAF
ncbi:hypothetical protein M501DRAFT_992353 [Patellaria atrata CBS 101060]|uniref:Uncharacterized protein n=1 Tax=Patellaria atrata CBS 101060 TaxID=1346257 RepID=A0A9P4SB17_9PEZI|nr:hypothetical protein M501DRAFT_992353 [Patellaria atrata CBS 101060]